MLRSLSRDSDLMMWGEAYTFYLKAPHMILRPEKYWAVCIFCDYIHDFAFDHA